MKDQKKVEQTNRGLLALIVEPIKLH